MIAWLLSSILLSALGAGVYLVFRKRFPHPRHQKRALWIMLVGSLTLPLVFGQLLGNSAPVARASAANTVEEYCHCQDPGANDKLMFEAVQGYEFLISHERSIGLGLLLVAGLMLSFLLIKVLYLWSLTRRRAVEAELDGIPYREVAGTSRMPAGSFRLFRKYMLWHPGLNALSETEQAAIRWHELSHLKQGNTYENLLLGGLQIVWFLNPVFYFFRAELNRISEFIADDLAVEKTGNAKQYALLLVRLKSQSWQPGISAFSNRKLKQRIMRLVAPPPHPPKRRAPFWLTLALLFPLMGGVAQYTIQDEMQEIRAYAYMSAQNNEKGTTEFCRRCTYESVAAPEIFAFFSP